MGQIHKGSTPAYLVIRRRTFKFPASYLCFESSKQDTTASGLDPTGVRLRILDAILLRPLGGVPVVFRAEYAN